MKEADALLYEWEIGKDFGKNPQAPMQLFNLENDVHEDCDVSEQHPDIVEQMEIFIKQAHVKSDLFPYPFEK